MKLASIYVFVLLLLNFNLTRAQSQSIIITGKVIEGTSQQPLQYASILLLDASSKQKINGAVTNTDGTFSLKTDRIDLNVEVGFSGFTTQTVTQLKVNNGKVDLGTIVLTEDTKMLNEVVVQGKKSQTIFKLDKRVFNVGQDLSSTGASALEVLNNVPSVTVNIEGQIRLRGSAGVQILIDGKPSVLTSEQGNALGTLTADMIESVEVITNPSAKYEASGTSGIINIVLKKEEKRGTNGSVTLNTGIPNNHSIGLSMNKRTEKFNLFSQVGIGHRTFPERYKTINRNLQDNTTINSQGDGKKNEKFGNIILGTDYHINTMNVLSLTGSFAYELETEFSDNDFIGLDSFNIITSQWNRKEVTEATNPKYQYELQYKKSFKRHKDQMLLLSAIGSFFGKDQSSEFTNIPVLGGDSFSDRQLTQNDFKQGEYTFKLDYTHPISKELTFETGTQYLITDVSNDYAISNWANMGWVENPDLTNIFMYNQKVLGVYGTAAYTGDKFGVKVGLRMENTNLSTVLVDGNQKNDQNFTNLFPTIHTSYKVLDNFSMQAGYSRRISRPGLFDLNPFYNIRNNFAISTGNPELMPEYTDSYEVNGIIDKGPVSLNAAIYYRYTTDMVEEVATFENNISILKPVNVGINKAVGVELNAKYDPANWWSLNGDFNYNRFRREGSYQATNFDFNADQWSARLTTKFKLPAKIDFEVMGNYQSSYQTFQRTISGFIFADLGLRKKIMKGRTILNLSMRDIFASRISETETVQPSFYLYDYRQRGRFVTFGISFGFGKGEAMEFSGQKQF